MRRKFFIWLAAAFLLATAGGCTLHKPNTDILSGKKILFLGDSLLAGYQVENNWPHLLEVEYGMVVTNASVNGSTMVSRGDSQTYNYFGSVNPISTREYPKDDYDMIMVTGGANDWMLNVALGPEDSCDPKFYRGALRYLIGRLRENNPDAILVFSTTWEHNDEKNPLGHEQSDYNEVMVQVCREMNVPCIRADDSKKNGITMTDVQFREKYCIASTDLWHLNEDGHAMYLPTIAETLAEIFQRYA